MLFRSANEGLPKLAEMIGMKSVNDLPEELAGDPSVKQIREVMDLLVKKGIKNAIFDITLMRGLDYYTGTVFEFFDNSPENNRALFDGGRYDGLVGLFGVEPSHSWRWFGCNDNAAISGSPRFAAATILAHRCLS